MAEKPVFTKPEFRKADFKALAAAAEDDADIPDDALISEELGARVDHVWDKLNSIRDRINQQNDHNFYVTLIFRSVAQKYDFLEKSGLVSIGEKFLNGEDAAAVLGVVIGDGVQMRCPHPHKVWAGLSDEIGGDHGTS
jgi:hypothetical protein